MGPPGQILTGALRHTVERVETCYPSFRWAAATLGGMPGIEDVPVFGAPEDVVRGLREVKDASAEMILLNQLAATVAQDRGQMERLAADVLLHLH